MENQNRASFEEYAAKLAETFTQSVEAYGATLEGRALSESERLAEMAKGMALAYEETSLLADAYARSADVMGIEGGAELQNLLDKKSFELKEIADGLNHQIATNLDGLVEAAKTTADSQLVKVAGEAGGAAVDIAQVMLGAVELANSDDGQALFESSAGVFIGTVAGVIAIGLGAPAVVAGVLGLGLGWAAEAVAGDYYDDFMDWLNDHLVAWDPLNIMPEVNADFQDAVGWTAPRDPLVLDLDGDGLETLGGDGTVLFEHDGDGIKHGTGWVGADDALLVMDRDGDA